MNIFQLIKPRIQNIVKSQLNPKLAAIEQFGNLGFSLIFGALAALCMLIYHFLSDYELVRQKFGDFEYDIAMKAYAYVKSAPNAPNIIAVLIDDVYLSTHDLNDSDGGLKFDLTPRSTLASVLQELDAMIGEAKPRALLLDYYLVNPSDLNATHATADDMTLVRVLNSISAKYPVYLPTARDHMFIEDEKLNTSVKFVSTQIAINKDGTARGYKPYLCKNTQVIPHIAQELKGELNLAPDCTVKSAPNASELFKSRILYKNIEHGSSGYENIKIYSATEAGSIGEEFADAIVIVGSNYDSSGDMHRTPIDSRAGAMILADAITTAYVAPQGIRTIGVANSCMLYFVMFSLVTFIALNLMDRLHTPNDTKLNVILILNIMLFFVPAIVMMFYGYYLVWIVPMILFEMVDRAMFAVKFWQKIRHASKLKIFMMCICGVGSVILVWFVG